MKPTCHKLVLFQFALPWALRFVFLSLLATTSALAATSLSIVSDQEYLPAVKLNGSARSLDVWGQFFKPSVSGRLYGIEIRAFHTPLMTADLEIELSQITPTQRLAKAVIPAQWVPSAIYEATNSILVTFDPVDVYLTQNATYVMNFTSKSAEGYFVEMGCPDRACASDGYTRGYAHQSGIPRSEDFRFRTFMEINTRTGAAPSVVIPPSELSARLNENVALRVGVTGSLPIAFRWFKNGKPLDSATNATLKFPSFQGDDEGSYSVVASNEFGVARTDPTRLTWVRGPFIQDDLGGVYLPLGDRLDVTAKAVGRGTLSYQWFHDGTPVGGGTHARLNFIPTLTDAGQYWVVVTDSDGASESMHFAVVVRDDSARVKWKRSLDRPEGLLAIGASGNSYLTTSKGAFSGYISAFSPNGTSLWDLYVGNSDLAGPMIIDNGDILTFDSRIFLWDSSQDPSKSTPFFVGSAPNDISRYPAYDRIGNRLFLVDHGGWARSFSLTGQALWQKRVAAQGFRSAVNYSPEAGLVYFIDPDDNLTALDADTGDSSWTFSGVISIPYTMALGDGNLLLAWSTDGVALIAIDAQAGRELWRYHGGSGAPIEPIVGEGAIYISGQWDGTGTPIVALDTQGRRLWSAPLTGNTYSAPALAADGTLYVQHGAFVSAVDTRTGQLKWDYLAGGFIQSPLAIAPDGSVLFYAGVGSGLNPLIALKGSAPLAATPWPKARADMGNSGSLRRAPKIIKAPTVTRAPLNVATSESETAQLFVEATGTAPLSYQWFQGETPIDGANSDTLALPADFPNRVASYRVIIRNPYGAAEPAAVQVTVLKPQRAWVITVAGDGSPGDTDEADARFGSLREPGAPVMDPAGNLLIPSGNNVRLFGLDGALRTFAGSSDAGFRNGAKDAALFQHLTGAARGANNDLVVADSANHRIRLISLDSGLVSTLAGNGIAGYLDSSPSESEFREPHDVAVDAQGAVYVVEPLNSVLRKITPDAVATLAGNAGPGYADGPGLSARFLGPSGIAVDGAGNLVVADTENHRIRRVSPAGDVTTLAGTNIAGFSDGPVSRATLNRPAGIEIDARGFIYFTELGNHSVRMLHPAGYVMTLAGDGVSGCRDGTNGLVRFASPGGIALAPDGALLVADTGNHLIRRLSFAPPTIRPIDPGDLSIELKPWLTVSGEPGTHYAIRGSDTVKGPWAVITNITLTSSNQSWFDLSPARRKFYRAVRTP
ncbi:MAG: PQQ-binding-like beta-propeller repeat protein [Verrucomicrobia bacterium]|nr:PQQ-binding-like beta-propeller repeat protein [Verrucomicrobiota bacterium]